VVFGAKRRLLLFCALFLVSISPSFAKEKMPDETRFDSGHAQLPVRAVNGDIHDVAIPDGTSLESVHAALSNDPKYLPDFSTAKPTAAGALENSEDFRNQSKAAWDAVSQGRAPYTESGFSVYNDGGASPLHTETHPQSAGMAGPQRDKISFGKDDFAIQHTHPNGSSDKPSTNDVEAAKKIKKPIYVTSRTGLWMASPDGKVTQVFKSPTWFSDKKPN
jgi:hypothetical protein